MKKIAIVDYKMGNLFSVMQACQNVNLTPVITSDKNTINESDAIILPGVGSFAEAMKNLSELDLIETITQNIIADKPFLGICLGFQLLFTGSEEFGNTRGMGIFTGKIKRFSNFFNGNRIKVPQIGWNQIKPSDNKKWANSLLKNINFGEYMYFVHSFYVATDEQKILLTTTEYEGFEYCSSIQHGNLFASQFHPEKSSLEGIKIYKNFADIIA